MKNREKQLQYLIDFTAAYQNNLHADKALRELACLKVQYPFMLDAYQDGDAVAGRYSYPVVYFVPQSYSAVGGKGYGYVFDEIQFNKLRQSGLSNSDSELLNGLESFWKKEDTASKNRPAFTAEMSAVLPSDEWIEEPGIAFPLYRMAGSQLHYDKLLQAGISDLRQEIRQMMPSSNNQPFYEGLLGILDILEKACLHYARQIEHQLSKGTVKNTAEARALLAALQKISHQKPETLLEAMQLFFLYNMLSGSLNFGRMDEYLGDFLIHDLQKGILADESAIELIAGLFKMMDARKTIFDGRVILGGKGRRNEANADKFALLAMQAIQNTRTVLPQLTLRFHKQQNPALYQKAIDVLATGCTYPLLYNDEENIPSVAKAFKIDLEEAQHYLPYGCGEYILNHRSFGSPNGIINLTKALEVFLNHGMDKVSGRRLMDLQTENTFDNFDDFLQSFYSFLELYFKQLAHQQALTYQIASENTSFLFLSLLFDDCLAEGKDVFTGGIRYLGGTIETYGNTNTADALYSIKELVFNKKIVNLEALTKAINNNFEGYGDVLKSIKGLPKYGNDDADVDSFAASFHEKICRLAIDAGKDTSMHSYLVVVINNQANTMLGRHTLASADGRKAFSPLANANNPSGGADKNGLTAMLNSLLKLKTDIHAGAVQNIKVSKDFFTRYRQRGEAILKAYFESGGVQAMITIINKGDLQNALKEPEKYAHVMVRVGGFSARFIDLEKDVQLEIISRTLY